MTSKEFIKSRLREIFDSIKSINIKYEYLDSEDTHLIEITPLSEFNDNSKYLELEKKLLFDFNDLYFPSTILFVSDDSLNQVATPEFSLKMIREEFSINFEESTIKPVWGFNFSPNKLTSGENNYALAA